MRSIRLIPIDAPLAAALDAPDAFAARYGASLGDILPQAREVAAMFTARGDPPAAWGGFLAAAEGAIVGTCAFKGPPSEAGEVEIAYYTFPGFEGRGYATAMADALVGLAAAGGARVALAHTLPQRGASARILEKLGMTFAGDAIDPEDGAVWRWEKRLREG